VDSCVVYQVEHDWNSTMVNDVIKIGCQKPEITHTLKSHTSSSTVLPYSATPTHAQMSSIDPNQTLYIKGLPEKVRVEGKKAVC
jgi:hypothetical protein